jgi:peptidyl-prolyl cis-trans isomerase B (cyclophilin B)
LSDNSARRDAALKNLDKELKSRSRRDKMRPLGVVLATVVVLVVIVGGIWFAVTRDNSEDENVAEDTTAAEETPTETSGPYTGTGDAAKEVPLPDGENIPQEGTTDVTLHTTAGDIGITLNHEQAPTAAFAIQHLVESGFYDDTICHRVVVSDGMKILQCGDPSGQGSGGPGFSFPDEYPVGDEDAGDGLYTRGVLAMANSGPDTNGSQFFLVDDDSQLTNDYTIFGSISEDGLATLDKIIEENADTEGADGNGGQPDPEVRITSATVED